MRQLSRSAGKATASAYPLGGGVELAEDAAQIGGRSAVASDGPAEPHLEDGAAGRRRPPFLTFTRKVLLSLMGVGVISAIVGSTMHGTHSMFTATTTNPGNTFAAGTLNMSNTGGSGCSNVVAAACGAITISAGNAGSMVAGETVSGTLTISNAGNLPAVMTLGTQNVSGALASHLSLTIHDDSGGGTGYCVYGLGGSHGAGACDAAPAPATDPFAAVSSLQMPGGTSFANTRWASGESHQFTVSVTFAGGDSGDSASIDLVWQAQQ